MADAQRRDFFLNGRPGDRDPFVIPEGFVWESSFERNEQLCGELVDAWRTSTEFRDNLLAECRNAAWFVRNRRMAEGFKYHDSLVLIVETFHLMRLAGVSETEAFAWVGCMGHACCCDGCDLANGARWRRLIVPSSG